MRDAACRAFQVDLHRCAYVARIRPALKRLFAQRPETSDSQQDQRGPKSPISDPQSPCSDLTRLICRFSSHRVIHGAFDHDILSQHLFDTIIVEFKLLITCNEKIHFKK